jgi:hypothetical protein
MQVLQRSLQPMLNTTNSNFMRLESQISNLTNHVGKPQNALTASNRNQCILIGMAGRGLAQGIATQNSTVEIQSQLLLRIAPITHSRHNSPFQ